MATFVVVFLHQFVKGIYLDGASEYLTTECSGNQVPIAEECQVKKIARRTIGAKECYFLQDLYPLYFSFYSNQKYNLQIMLCQTV